MENVLKVSVRDLQKSDIPFILKYWFHSPVGFIQSIGIDPEMLPSEDEMKEFLEEKCLENQKAAISQINSLTILVDDQPIGFHTINPLTVDEEGIFHAHIWDESFRRKGVATKSYLLACSTFMERFNLERIIFKTPKQNIAAIKVKEKLGFRYAGEEVVSFGIIKDNTAVKVYEVEKSEVEQRLEMFFST